MTATAVDVLAALDFDHQQPCAVRDGCPYAGLARWRVTYVCGCVSLLCARCLTDVRDMMREFTGQIVEAKCHGCGETRKIPALELISSVEALP